MAKQESDLVTAELPFVNVTRTEAQLVKVAMGLYAQSLRRMLVKEVPGSELHKYRSADILTVERIRDSIL